LGGSQCYSRLLVVSAQISRYCVRGIVSGKRAETIQDSSFPARAGGKGLRQESGQQLKKGTSGPRPLINSMRATRISHHREWFVRGHQRVNQGLGALVVNVVVPGAVYDQQLSLQLRSKGDCRALFVLVRVVLWQPAVPLLIDRIVVPQIGDGSHRD